LIDLVAPREQRIERGGQRKADAGSLIALTEDEGRFREIDQRNRDMAVPVIAQALLAD